MNRYDFVYLFDAKDANPNGDPDAGNLPRIDPESGHGLITDVCIKRKVRNYVGLTRKNESPYEIYFTEGAILNKIHERAYDNAGIKPTKKPPKDAMTDLTSFMCRNFYDIRTFGAVMSTEVNCGQVRGPVQFSFARSSDPIVSSEHAITRSSVTNERDAEKERTIGRKFTVPYALYRMQGFVNPFFADQTGFGDEDLELLWEALANAFQFDQSAARPAGSMAARRLIVFKHENQLGGAPSHRLFDSVKISRIKDDCPARSYSDYRIETGSASDFAGVELVDMIE